VSRKPIANPLLDVDGEFDPVNLINPYSFAVAGGSFDPLSISGCVLWLKADGDVYNTGTTQATDGQTVETWADMSGNGRNAVYFAGTKPVFQTNEVNGKPVVEGGASWGGLVFSLPTLTAGTLFWVGKHLCTNTCDVHEIGGSALGDPRTYYPHYGSASMTFGTNTRKTFTEPSGAKTDWQAISISANTSWKCWVNGSNKLDTSNTFSAPSTTDSRIMWNTQAQFAEFILYNSALGTTDREDVEDYLGTKYGVTITH